MFIIMSIICLLSYAFLFATRTNPDVQCEAMHAIAMINKSSLSAFELDFNNRSLLTRYVLRESKVRHLQSISL